MSRLKRVRYGDVFLPSKLKKGQWVELPQRDVDVIYQMAGLPNREVAPLSEKSRSDVSAMRRRVSAPRAAADGKFDHGCALSARPWISRLASLIR